MPLAGQRGQQRQVVSVCGADRQVHILERPLQRELSGSGNSAAKSRWSILCSLSSAIGASKGHLR
jgi:hypothetical protein